MIRYETEHLLLCQFRDFKRLNSLENKATLKKTLKWASSRRKVGTFSEQCWGDLEQGTEPPKVEMPVQGSFLTLTPLPQ